MVGNVLEWVQDKYQGSYDGAPADGSAFEGDTGFGRVLRGGSFGGAGYLRADFRYRGIPGDHLGGIGFRLARESR